MYINILFVPIGYSHIGSGWYNNNYIYVYIEYVW